MASAALISYPRFNDLEKSNINFVETIPNLKKSRRLSSEKKEQLVDNATKEHFDSECNVTSDRDRYNTLRIKKKEIQILPTLDEKEEKVEANNYCTMDNNEVQVSESPKKYETKIMHNQNSRMALKSKISNHTLVIKNNNNNIKPLSSEHNMSGTVKKVAEPRELSQFTHKSKPLVEVAPSGTKLNVTSILTPLETDTYCSGFNLAKRASSTAHNKPQILNGEKDIKTLMPNTIEFQGTSLNETMQKACELQVFKSNPNINQFEVPISSKCNAKEFRCEQSSSKSCMPSWKCVLGILWTFTFTGALIYVGITNTDKKSDVIVQPIKYEPTNYEILQLIAKNFRRLIVSSFYAFRF